MLGLRCTTLTRSKLLKMPSGTLALKNNSNVLNLANNCATQWSTTNGQSLYQYERRSFGNGNAYLGCGMFCPVACINCTCVWQSHAGMKRLMPAMPSRSNTQVYKEPAKAMDSRETVNKPGSRFLGLVLQQISSAPPPPPPRQQCVKQNQVATLSWPLTPSTPYLTMSTPYSWHILLSIRHPRYHCTCKQQQQHRHQEPTANNQQLTGTYHQTTHSKHRPRNTQ